MMHCLLAATLILLRALCAAADGPVAFKDPRTCKGQEKEYRDCEDLPVCYQCEPQDCAFSEWGEWFEAGGCTGVCFRHRSVVTSNNECGQPCKGLTQETKQCLKAQCVPIPQDCLLTDWSVWTDCNGDFTAQKSRARTMALEPMNGGKECSGAVNETAPCGENPAVDCVLSEWGAWTECSASCGGGWHSQTRRVLTRASLGGKPCEGGTRRTGRCSTQPCGVAVDCALGAWSTWTGCGLLGGEQRYRGRDVETPAAFGGAACAEAVKETQGCPVSTENDAKPCQMTEWTDWAECSQSCDGGQSYRKRRLQAGPRNGGGCLAESLHETRPCGVEPCLLPGSNDCGLSDWAEWSACPVKCGVGLSQRQREVLAPAKLGGKGCNAVLKETRGCRASEETCGATDCVWDDWQQWSACSCTCGGGTMRRERMIKVAPTRGGRLCSAKEKAEVSPCNTQTCNICVDGAWADWEAWTACSATCGEGFRSRHRDVAQHPNDCGKAVLGLEDEYERCTGGGPCVLDNDCELSDWTAWSACSSRCFGVAERQRHVVRYATGQGRRCHMEAAKEVAQCNPTLGERMPEECGMPDPEACVLDMWADWGACSASCDGGQRVRTRHVLSPAKNNGIPCTGDLSMTSPCATQSCEGTVQDCEWEEWSDWGQCSKCGDQRYRHRGVRRMPNALGKPCDAMAAKEASGCNSTCESQHFCAWSDWSSFSPCSADCGPATRLRQRAMVTFATAPSSYIFVGPASSACSAAQMEIGACEYTPCGADSAPVDCIFGAWAEWSAPTCTQLCERHRVIERMSQNMGKLCEGQLVETKRCERDCTHAEDCKLSDWGDWGFCEKHESQRYRSRSVTQYASNGGEECEGHLEETASCSEPPAAITACSFSEWSRWSACSSSCGGGLQTRERSIQNPAENGGAMCKGKLQELSMCNTQMCGGEAVSCVMSDWSAWSNCSRNLDGSSSKVRDRQVLRPPQHGGMACSATLRELQACSASSDCQLSQWTSWDQCDKTCGGGQHVRHRQVVQNPEAGGRQCSPSLMEIQGCNDAPCNRRDCAVSDWIEWGECSASCGSGQQGRSRKVVQLPLDGGDGCHVRLEETRECRDGLEQPLAACPTVDCVWGLWSDWSSCSCKCEGGVRSRDRHIIQAPQKGGKPCMAWSKEETEPCNTQPCAEKKCIDGQWDSWQDWEPCSSTCKGGLTWRARRILMEANECGTPATGESRMYSSCHADVACEPDVDCQLSDWAEWSDCSKTCNGLKRRSRHVAVIGRGKGAACAGDLKQTAPCAPSSGKEMPAGCAGEVLADCQLSTWLSWTSCSVSCGGGQQSRSRDVAAEAMGGGHCPLAPLSETRACSRQACPDQCLPTNCAWNDWSSWSACDKCGGEKRRFRHVQRVAQCGGQPCDAGLSEEVANCTRKCHEPSYCTFGDWGSWGACSASCGSGTQSRERHLELASRPELHFVADAEDSSLLREFQQLRWETDKLQRQQVQSLVMSFIGGLLSLLAGLAAMRVFSRGRSARPQRDVEINASLE